MNAVKKNRLEEAKLAKAYLAGGMPPYQAARKCGFMRVAAMEEAIRELEAAEAPAAPQIDEDPSRYLYEKAPIEPPKEWNVPVPAAQPLESWENEVGAVLRYGRNGDKEPAYRINLYGTRSYLMIPEDRFKSVAQLMADAAGLKCTSNDRLLADMAEERETAYQEAQQHLAELKRNEALQAENDRLAELNAALQADLETEKANHNALKLRVFDILLAEKDGK